MTQPGPTSQNQSSNGHYLEKPDMNGHTTSAPEMNGSGAGARMYKESNPNNPFHAIGQELEFLSSGVRLSLGGDAGLEGPVLAAGSRLLPIDGSGLGLAESSRGREWMRAVKRISEFVESSDERIYQISPSDPSANPSPYDHASSKFKRVRPASLSKSQSSGLESKRARTQSNVDNSTVTRQMGMPYGQASTGRKREVDVYPDVPKELVRLVYPTTPSSSSSPSSSDKIQVDTLEPGTSDARRRGSEAPARLSPIWSSRERLEVGLNEIQNSKILVNSTTKALTVGPGPGGGTNLDPGLGLGLNVDVGSATAMAAATSSSAPSSGLGSGPGPQPAITIGTGLEFGLEDYWLGSSGRLASGASKNRADRASPSTNSASKKENENENLDSPSIRNSEVHTAANPDSEPDSEFTIQFRLRGCFKGWAVFGRRVTKTRPKTGSQADMGARKTGERRMVAFRFNLFADTETNKGKNDVSAYKAMIDLGIYLAGLGLGLEETLIRLGTYSDFMTRPCFVCQRLFYSGSTAGPGPGAPGGLPIGRARACSGGDDEDKDNNGWRAYHLECLRH